MSRPSDKRDPGGENGQNPSCHDQPKPLRHRPLSQIFSNSHPTPPSQAVPRLPVVVRAAWAILGILLVGGFCLAARLHPDPSGLGTHQQLGLPACSMQVFLGIPCPSCGMTTSFSHFVRGQWPSAFLVNPAGFLLAAACLAAIPWAGCLAFSGRYQHVFAPMEVFLWTAGAVTIVSFVQWLIRILVS